MEDSFIFRILLAHLTALPPLWAVAAYVLREKRIRAALLRPGSTPTLPPAAETRRSVLRFQEAARRYEMLDFVWERWLRNRALFFRQESARTD